MAKRCPDSKCSGLIAGYGAEETCLDLKMALLDKTNYLDATLGYFHYPGVRGYPRHNSDDYFRNL